MNKLHIIKMRMLMPALLAALTCLMAMPAEAQSNDDSRPALTVRRQRQGGITKRTSTTKKAATTSKTQAASKAAANKTTAASKAKTGNTAALRTGGTKTDTTVNTKHPTPPAFLRQRQAAAKKSASSASESAQGEFPVAPTMPADVTWRRDIYRELDLTKDANASLYYPLEQQGDQINLFTYIMKLILRGQVKAYDYTLTGNENFSEKNQIKPKDILDRYHIYYETKDGRTHINDSDIPAAEVQEYFIKESSYFDQHTATYHTQVMALCPVLKRADDFGGADAKYPMFWVKYSDLSPYLAKLPLTGSNYNNAATMSADDYFSMNRYDGKIYKTNNLQGRVLANYCTTDSAMAKEQKKIENQLSTFENHIWGKDSTDSAKVKTDSVETKKSKSRRRSLSSRRSSSKASKSSGSSSSSAPRVSVRRQRH